MGDPKYLRPLDVEFCRNHVVEEAGELLAAIGKAGRWGWESTNPEIPNGETNLEWVKREADDLVAALERLDGALRWSRDFANEPAVKIVVDAVASGIRATEKGG